MEAKDLRIGVILYDSLRDKNIEISLKHFKELDISEKNFFERYKPISLTEEWLLKAGFYKEEYNNEMVFYKGEFIFRAILSNKIPGKFLHLDINNNSTTSVKYLHDLQNLVKSLTGQELKIDLK